MISPPHPSVSYPTALAWVPDLDCLLVATRAGALLLIDPVLGTETIADGIGWAEVVAVADDRHRYLLMTRCGDWTVGTLDRRTLFAGRHPFRASLSGHFVGAHVVLVGETPEGSRAMVVYQGDRRTACVRLPDRVVAMSDDRGDLELYRSTPTGLEVLRLRELEQGASFRKGRVSTPHILRACRTHVLGITPRGIAMWTRNGGPPSSLGLDHVTAGDVSEDGTNLGFGTSGGAVMFIRRDAFEQHAHPDKVRCFRSPVTSLAFSPGGKWVATGAESLRLWRCRA